jgi:RNA polymerase sigma factor (sigma-70 family)
MIRATASHSLLARLSAGDADAIRQTILRYQDELCNEVRRRIQTYIRGKFDPEDIVHSVWAKLLPHLRACRWKFDDPKQLRAFLLRSACHHLHNRARRMHVERRCVADRGARVASPPPEEAEETLRMEELWHQILASCPPTHQDLLRLKREGWSLEQIAALKGLHKSSVRRVLYETLRRLRAACPSVLPPEPVSVRAPDVADDRLETWVRGPGAL